MPIYLRQSQEKIPWRLWIWLDERITGTNGTRNQRENEQRVGAMTDFLNLAVLIGGSVGSLAFGVWAAYGILRLGFSLICPRPRSVAVKVQPEAAL